MYMYMYREFGFSISTMLGMNIQISRKVGLKNIISCEMGLRNIPSSVLRYEFNELHVNWEWGLFFVIFILNNYRVSKNKCPL